MIASRLLIHGNHSGAAAVETAKEGWDMRGTTNTMTRKALIVGGLLLMMSMIFIGSVQAAIPLTTAEKTWLTYMREEEKLARDVYLLLSQRWGLAIFSTIAASEQTHMDAIKTLLDRYGLPDPAEGKGLGEFNDPTLQALYNDLILQGGSSEIEALTVGKFIEETDIDDLTQAIASAQRKDIKTVYSNLLQASVNHLTAFVSALAKYGVTY
jgi:hypothetical protein